MSEGEEDGDAWDVYFLRLALHQGYEHFRKDLVEGYSAEQKHRLLSRLSDIEIAVITMKRIIDGVEDFSHYPLLEKLLTAMWNHVRNDNPSLDTLFDHAVFYTRMMHLFRQIGRETADKITSLMLDYYPDMRSDQAFTSAISDDTYLTLKRYVLEVLLSKRRSVDFANRFPEKLDGIREKLTRTFANLIVILKAGLPPCELLQPFDQLPVELRTSPIICYYYQSFAKNGIFQTGSLPSEYDLVRFLRRIRESQISTGIPDGLFLPTPSVYDDTLASCHCGRPLSSNSLGDNVQHLTGSDDLFASPDTERRRSSNGQCSFHDPGYAVFTDMNLKELGISKVYDPDGNIVVPKMELFDCQVLIEMKR